MSTQTWCGTCLSRGRCVSPLGEARYEYIVRNIGQSANRTREVGTWLSACLECRALIDKSLLFCERVRRAQSMFMGFAGQNLSSISTLRAVLKVGYDYEFTSVSHKESIHALDSTEVEVSPPSLIKEEFEGHSTTVEDIESLIDIAEMKLEPNGGFILMEYKHESLECHVDESSTNVRKPSECISTVNSSETIGFEKEPSLSDVPEDASKEGLVEGKMRLNEPCEESLQQLRCKKLKNKEYIRSMFKCEKCILGFPNYTLFEEHHRREHTSNISSISTLEAVLKIGSDNEFTCESHKESARTPDSSTEAGAPHLSLIKDELDGYSTASEDPESFKDNEINSEPNGAFIMMDYKRAPSECQVHVSSTKFIEKPSECILTVDAEEQFGVKKESLISDEFEDSLLNGVLVEAKIIFNDLSEETLQQLRYEERNEEEYVSSPYKCETCIIVFPNCGLHEIHNKRKHSLAIGPHVCDVCAARFPEENKLRAHRAEHYKRHTCALCGFSRLSLTVVQRHYTVEHDTDRVLPCAKCNQVFSNNLQLQKHISKSHNAKRKYMCDVCGRTFKEKQQIKYHMKEHTREMPYACALCGTRSATSTAHRIHMLVHTPPENKSPETYCVECDRYFKNKYILRMHYKQSLKHVSKYTFRHACSECEERFPGASALRVHMNTSHLNNRTHPCDACEKAYFTQGALNAHIKDKHSAGERTKDHLCPVCNRCFVTKSQLKAHSRIHTKERPYACLLCPATFGFSSALYMHKKLKHKMTTAELKTKLGRKKT